MKTSLRFLCYTVVLILPALLTTTPTGASGKGWRSQQSQKKSYERGAHQGAIYGTVSFQGEAPKRREIDMSADSVCAEINRDPASEDVVVTGGKLAHVFVYVKSGSALEEFEFAAPEQPAVIERRKCQYLPHVLGLQAGQTLSVVNADDTAHNTNVRPSLNPTWNVSQPPNGEPVTQQFNLAETFFPLKCNQHPWEKAWLGVFAHPFFSTSGMDGAYRIEGLPDGTYTLVAWHEKFGEKEVTVTISSGEQKSQEFIFEAKDGG